MVYLILSPLLSLALLSGMTVSLANKNGSDKERYVILMWLCFLLAPSLGGLAAFLPRATYFDSSLFIGIGITIASRPFGCPPHIRNRRACRRPQTTPQSARRCNHDLYWQRMRLIVRDIECRYCRHSTLGHYPCGRNSGFCLLLPVTERKAV